MVFGFCMLVVLYLLYVLLIKGLLWKIILGAAGWFGIYWYLKGVPECQAYPFNNDTFTWAAIIPTLIVLMAMEYTKEE